MNTLASILSITATTSTSIILFTVIFLNKPFNSASALPLLNFQWTASLDSKSGLAQSFEQSHSHSIMVKKWAKEVMQQKSQELFRDYPKWLCRFGTTLGLLRAVEMPWIVEDHEFFFAGEKEGSRKRKVKHVVRICSSLFGLELLTFGVPEDEDVQYGKHLHSEASCCVRFPVLGGILAYKPAKGCICFDMHLKGVEKMNESNGDVKSETQSLVLESRVEDYHPAISGGVPVNPVRRLMYLGSQRLVHAYVMHRFHCYYHDAMQLEEKSKMT